MYSDPIADMLTRIRNAQMSRKATAEVPKSKFKQAIADILSKEGYVGKVEIAKNATGSGEMLVIELKYNGKQPAISSIKRESSPGHRKYTGAQEMPKVLNGFGLAIISTPKGLMTNKEALAAGIGGEVICSVY